VERTHSWLNRYRQLRIRYERLAEIRLAFLYIGCTLICWKLIQQEFC
jgi:transposase